jgi:hypothetical protein
VPVGGAGNGNGMGLNRQPSMGAGMGGAGGGMGAQQQQGNKPKLAGAVMAMPTPPGVGGGGGASRAPPKKKPLPKKKPAGAPAGGGGGAMKKLAPADVPHYTDVSRVEAEQRLNTGRAGQYLIRCVHVCARGCDCVRARIDRPSSQANCYAASFLSDDGTVEHLLLEQTPEGWICDPGDDLYGPCAGIVELLLAVCDRERAFAHTRADAWFAPVADLAVRRRWHAALTDELEEGVLHVTLVRACDDRDHDRADGESEEAYRRRAAACARVAAQEEAGGATAQV